MKGLPLTLPVLSGLPKLLIKNRFNALASLANKAGPGETMVVAGVITNSPSAGVNGTEAPKRTEDEVERFMRGQQMMSDAINQHMGFRGYGLMMRLQKTANIRDLHDLLREFAAALVKRIGMDKATPIVSEIEALIDPRQ